MPARIGPPRTATTRVVTQINRTAILDAVREHGPLTRRQICERTGLSSATVERLCGALITAGSLIPDGQDGSAGGRPSTLLRYSGAAQLVLAAEVGASIARARLVDLDGRHVAEQIVELDADETEIGGPARVEALLTAIEAALADASTANRPCRAIGVVVPGLVHDGHVTKTAELGWRDVPLAAIVAGRTGIPTTVENDANAIAYGEHVAGAARGASTVAAYVLGVGAGCGLVTGGQILRGARSAAGEVGFLFADSSALSRWFTEEGDVELRIGAAARQGAGADVPAVRAAGELIRRSAAGDPAAEAAAHELFDLIAFSLGAVCAVVDPEVVVLAGALVQDSEHVLHELHRRLTGRLPFEPRLVTAENGSDAALVGVSELVIQQVRGATYLS
ncbi:MAG TPA: ROK family transcriptional regulator [Cellulomonas sp.]